MLIAETTEIFAPSPAELVRRIDDLPSLPAIYFRVKSILERPDSSLVAVEREISSDAGLTSRLLCLANSTFYSLRGTLDSVGLALSVLGTEQVKHLLLVTSMAAAFRGIAPGLMDMRKFWRLNAYRALVARALARRNRRFDGERAFVEGLLGDIGHLVMYLGMPRAAEKALLRSRETGEPLHRVERDMLGFDYTDVGAELLAAWNISPQVEAAVRHHQAPLVAGGTAAGDASILHIATLFAEAEFASEAIESWGRRVDPVIWLEAGLSADCLPEVRMQVEDALGALEQALMPTPSK
jgi:HD-like signal output (HDOD) protein